METLLDAHPASASKAQSARVPMRERWRDGSDRMSNKSTSDRWRQVNRLEGEALFVGGAALPQVSGRQVTLGGGFCRKLTSTLR